MACPELWNLNLLHPPADADRFMRRFTERVDTNTRAYFAWVYTARWLGFRMDVVVTIVIAASCFFSVAVNEYSESVGECREGGWGGYVLPWTRATVVGVEHLHVMSLVTMSGPILLSPEHRLS